MPQSERLKEAVSLHQSLLDLRKTWDVHNKDISDYIAPRYGRFADKGDSMSTDGKKRMQKVKDGTAMRALQITSRGLFTGLCPPTRPFFRMAFMDKELMEYGPARMWADLVEKRMYWVLQKSNFYRETFRNLLELPIMGSGATWTSPRTDTVMHWQTRTWGEYAFGLDGWGEVNTCSVAVSMPLSGVAARWGTRTFTQGLLNRLEKNPHEWANVVFMVRPRDFRNPEKMDAMNMPFKSQAWLEDGEDILFEGGYNEFPVMVSRWEVIGSSIYGYGLGHDILPDVKMLQELQDKRLKGVALSQEPPVKVPVGFNRRLLTAPGGQNPIGSTTPDSIGPLYQVQIDLRGLLDALQDTRTAIRSGAFNEFFLALERHPEMSATEALIRDQEKAMILGPVVENMMGYLDQNLSRLYNEMARTGWVPNPPKEVAGQNLRLEYTSAIAQNQQQAGFVNIARFLQVIDQVAAKYGEVIDKVDMDQVVDEVGQILGVPPGIIRSDEIVARIRQARSQAQAAQVQGEQAQNLARAAKDLSQAQMEKPSLLSKFMGQAGQG